MVIEAEHTLYVVATPIGNRQDFSARAIAVLSSVDRIYAEDTRHSKALLHHHGVLTPLFSLHEHNESSRIESVLAHLKTAGNAALISDAGTPLISDPGYRIVRACHAGGFRVSPVPGPSALIAALSVSGLATDRFMFVGFPPARSLARKKWLSLLAIESQTLVLYESPHRIMATLCDLVEIMGEDREVCLSRELTKRYETVMHTRAADLLDRLRTDSNQQRGEFVLVIAGSGDAKIPADQAELDRVLTILLQQLTVKGAARCAAELLGIPKKRAYEAALRMAHK